MERAMSVCTVRPAALRLLLTMICAWTLLSAGASSTMAQAFYQINSGGPANFPYSADMLFNGGNTYQTSNAISTVGVDEVAWPVVYQTERYSGGSFSYTLPFLNPGKVYNVILHFAEIYYTAAGQRQFNVTINGKQMLSNFDIFASATVGYQALTEQFLTPADNNGVITITFTNVIGGAKCSGLEVWANGYGDRTGWTASASGNYPTDPPNLALDANPGTRWTSGVQQAPGQWFAVDMKKATSISNIYLDNCNSPYDYPRHYAVYLSNDGINWGNAVVTDATNIFAANNPTGNYRGFTFIGFPRQTARYIKVVQTGSATWWWWSICEFYAW